MSEAELAVEILVLRQAALEVQEDDSVLPEDKAQLCACLAEEMDVCVVVIVLWCPVHVHHGMSVEVHSLERSHYWQFNKTNKKKCGEEKVSTHQRAINLRR